jgi:hypothetical protein
LDIRKLGTFNEAMERDNIWKRIGKAKDKDIWSWCAVWIGVYII